MTIHNDHKFTKGQMVTWDKDTPLHWEELEKRHGVGPFKVINIVNYDKGKAETYGVGHLQQIQIKTNWTPIYVKSDEMEDGQFKGCWVSGAWFKPHV